LRIADSEAFAEKLNKMRALYEPYAAAIGRNLFYMVPPWIHSAKTKDNWQAGPWDRAVQARSLAQRVQTMEEHF